MLVRKLTCPDCNVAYIGQTGRNFNKRYKEHKSVFKTNSHTSNYDKHILEQSHTFGPIHQTMQILQYQDKGTHLNTIERFFIYAEFSKNHHLNDEYSISPNRIFEALLKPH
jgi:predicted GIY-YIG superfamily endonuclease